MQSVLRNMPLVAAPPRQRAQTKSRIGAGNSQNRPGKTQPAMLLPAEAPGKAIQSRVGPAWRRGGLAWQQRRKLLKIGLFPASLRLVSGQDHIQRFNFVCERLAGSPIEVHGAS